MAGSLPSGAGVAGQPSGGDLRTQAELRLVYSCAAVATVSRSSHPVQRQMGAGWLGLHPVWNLWLWGPEHPAGDPDLALQEGGGWPHRLCLEQELDLSFQFIFAF